MRFWLVHSNEVSLHDQIVRQVTLGALSGELAPGERLPSIREMARRFSVHANTVSAAYRELHTKQIVEYRKGSGVYVRHRGSPNSCNPLQALLDELVNRAKRTGVHRDELQRRLASAYASRSRLLLCEPDRELARIVQHEAANAGYAGLALCSLPLVEWPIRLAESARGLCPVVMPSKASSAREALGADVMVLGISPIAGLLADKLPVSREYLVGIASGWPRFVENTKQMLVAAGFAGDTLLLRDTRQHGWYRGLEEAATVVCDSLTATLLPKDASATVFPLLAAESVQALRERFEEEKAHWGTQESVTS